MEPITTECKDIAMQLFSGLPKGPCTIQLSFEEVDNEYIFQTLLTILLDGLYIIYGENFDINNLTPEIIIHINEYMKSIGYIITKYINKEGHCYCTFRKGIIPFIIDKHQYEKNRIIERNKISEYYINLGKYQLNFDFYR